AEPGDLVGPQPGQVVPVEGPGARLGPVEAGEEVEERGLAGAVRPDQRGDHAPLDLEVLDVDGLQAPERAGDPVGHDERVRRRDAGAALHAGQRPGTATGGLGHWAFPGDRPPRTPWGRKMTSSIRARPTSARRSWPMSRCSM